MLFIFSTPELIRNLWQLKTAVFPHWCLICALPLFTFFKVRCSITKDLCSDHFHGRLQWPGGISKDRTVWLDKVRPHPNYAFKNNEFDKLKNLANLDHTSIILHS